MRHVLDASREIPENSLQLFRVRPRAKHAVLSSPELRRGNRFHRLRQLLRVFDRANPAPDVQETWHGLRRAASFVLEAFLRFGDRLLQTCLDFVVDGFALPDLLEQCRMAGIEEAVQKLLE